MLQLFELFLDIDLSVQRYEILRRLDDERGGVGRLFRDGLDVGSRDVLEELARREGLSAGFLDTEQYAAEVRGDEEEAKKLGIRLVPHFIIDGKLTYKGALSQDYMTGVFRNIMQKNNLLPPEGKGITCGPDGCTLG